MHFRAGSLPTRSDIFCEPGEMYQLLGNFTLAYKGPFPLLSIKQPLIYQLRDGLAGRHAADPILFAQLSLGWNKFTRLPFTRMNPFPYDLFQLIVARQRTVSVNSTHLCFPNLIKRIPILMI